MNRCFGRCWRSMWSLRRKEEDENGILGLFEVEVEFKEEEEA